MISNKLLSEISEMDVADLTRLYREVVALIRHKQAHEAFAKSMTFMIGDKVSFIGRRGIKHTGEIVKRNPRKAVVAVVAVKPLVGDFPASMKRTSTVKWSVPYEMLTKVK